VIVKNASPNPNVFFNSHCSSAERDTAHWIGSIRRTTVEDVKKIRLTKTVTGAG
jgi:hypothetical protein